MLFNAITTALSHPSMMLIIAAITLLLNIFLMWNNNKRFKKKELDKKADVLYVDKEIRMVRKETGLEIKRVEKIQESNLDFLKDMSEKINFIYQKHYKP